MSMNQASGMSRIGRLKVFSGLLVAFSGLLVVVTAGSASASGTFTDDDGNVHEPMIEAIAAEGLTVGCSTTLPLYCPSDEVLRSGMATFIVRSLGEEGNLPPYQGYFADVPEGHWYTPYIERLYELGITEGCDTDPLRYCPLGTVLRSEMAVFLVRQVEGDTGLPSFQGYFEDVAEGEWYTQHVERLYQLGITAGCTTDPLMYCPDGPVLRDQMASFLGRTLGLDPTDICDRQTSIPLIECDALVALYNNTNGPGWDNRTGWLTDPDPCAWQGIECRPGSVSVISLVYNSLQGAIPPELGDFTSLQLLALQGNSLTGPIPSELGNLTSHRLLDLVLFDNQLTGPIPAELGSVTSLQNLYLGNNQLTGPIPSELGNLINLNSLNLENNQLSGPIPPELGNLNLGSLSLSENQLTGPIPPELGNLNILGHLNLSGNQLTGSIPPELGNLNARYLDLGYNQLSDPIPPELGNLIHTWTLLLNGNQLSGSIPSELGDLVSARTLNLGDNHLSGAVPPEFQHMGILRLLELSGQSGCLTAAGPSFAGWLTTFSPDWNDGCPTP